MKFNEYESVEKEYNLGRDSNFMKLAEGENIVRIVSEFEVRGVHQYKDGGKFFSPICIGKDKGCVYCRENVKLSIKYLGWVIDKKDEDKFKLLEIGHTIFKQIGELQEDEDYKFESTPDYNIKIIRKGKGLDTEYQVVPSPKRVELSKELQSQVLELKPIAEIIDAMKKKKMLENPATPAREETYGNKLPIIDQSDIPVVEDDPNEINVNDIPF